MLGFSPLLRWLRAPLRVRWYWPQLPRQTAEGLSADVQAVRFIEPYGPDLELHNVGDGSALDLEITIALAPGNGELGDVLARLPVLGVGVHYRVTLATDLRETADAGRLRISWHNQDGSAAQRCWAIRDGDRLTAVPCSV